MGSVARCWLRCVVVPGVTRVLSISPAFEWAQSPTEVYLQVKYAHKLDTPATLGCEADNVTIADKRVQFSAVCAAKRKRFNLNLGLLRSVDSDLSSWSTGSVGRATLTLRKSEPQVWSRLLATPQKPNNMHVWWVSVTCGGQVHLCGGPANPWSSPLQSSAGVTGRPPLVSVPRDDPCSSTCLWEMPSFTLHTRTFVAGSLCMRERVCDCMWDPRR